VIGHADRVGPLQDYCIGLLLPCERKSVEPMAAMTAPARVSAQHQSMLHFISQGGWSEENVLGKVREMVVPEMERHGPIKAWIIDDTGFPKQGKHFRQFEPIIQIGLQLALRPTAVTDVAGPAWTSLRAHGLLKEGAEFPLIRYIRLAETSRGNVLRNLTILNVGLDEAARNCRDNQFGDFNIF
jgi:hypothetical protein